MSAARQKPSSVDALRRGVSAESRRPSADLTPQIGQAPADLQHRPRPEKPVRFTLDLDRAHHQFLKDYAVQAEARGAAEVMRALLDELRDDPELAARVRARIWQH